MACLIKEEEMNLSKHSELFQFENYETYGNQDWMN